MKATCNDHECPGQTDLAFPVTSQLDRRRWHMRQLDQLTGRVSRSDSAGATRIPITSMARMSFEWANTTFI
jgi:hypothetical protein